MDTTARDSQAALAHTLFAKGLHADAAAICRQVLATQPDDPQLNSLLGVICLKSGDFAQAIPLFEQAVRHDPGNAGWWSNLVIAWRESGDIEKALGAAQRLVEISPRSAVAYNLLGQLFYRKQQTDRAIECLRVSYEIEPVGTTAYAVGGMLRRLRRHQAAVEWFRKAVAHDPGHARAHLSLAECYIDLGQFSEAKAVCDQSLLMGNASTELYSGLGLAEAGLLRPAHAVTAYRNSLAIDPGNRIAVSNMANVIAHLCEWSEAEKYQGAALDLTLKAIEADEPFCMMPFTALTMDLPPETQRRITAQHVRVVTGGAATRAAANRPRGELIVVGYLSSDFRDHPVMHLARNLFRHHDRRRFRVIGYSSGPDDGSEYRKHVERTCDRFVDIRTMAAPQAAERIAADGVDILVDMTGHTAMGRLDVIVQRPAAIQMHFLGYPGTMATAAIDYFVTDHFLSPPGAESYFSEKLIYMPDTYQISDDEQRPARIAVGRSVEGLPEDAFVFCSFNSSYKIEPVIFDCWMEILRRTPGSVLWLLAGLDVVAANLRRAAEQRGVDAARLVFARRVQKPMHLARHALADLFLDTWLVCGHTTANDALQMSLPVLACPRPNFISRVSSTLLRAHGLSELVCASLAEYVELAVTLARDPERLRALRVRLREDDGRIPARDTVRFVRNLERAYARAMELHWEGRPPEHLDVAQLPQL